VATLFVAMQTGCSDYGTVQPPSAPPASRAESRAADASVHNITLLDGCDPATFNAVLGAGTCVKSGGVTFTRFIAQLTQRGVAEAWRFTPTSVEARVGQSLLALNNGGEVHTFTEVASFGGGVVPRLNELSGNRTVAPECAALAPTDFVPSGGTDTDILTAPGTELYQCCIHPWMRTVVHIRS
jgi:plastocyanin